MCGICGKLNFDREAPVSSELLRRMTRIMEHRGPDDAGHYIAGPVALGHRRLSIIDLTTGTQPMSNEDETIWIVFNGEIYNFVALRQELIKRGHRFKSSSDTEVIVHLYEEFGDDCIGQLQGMFAFALWDARRQRLLLARDRVGIKPLYYCVTDTSLVFASEIKSILEDHTIERRLDLGAIDRFFGYYYVPGESTPLRGVRKLKPGHYLTVEDGRVAEMAYWDLKFGSEHAHLGLDEAADALRSLLSDTVKSHMISDVPVGILLSGGVDSTGMLHFAAEHASGPLHSFTLGFSGSDVPDERPYARLAAERFGSVHHETTLSAEVFGDFLPSYVWHMEELICEPPAIALHCVARLARETGVKVLLSGEGGDEAFAGYPEYRNLRALETLKTIAGPLKGLLSVGFGALEYAGWRRGAHYRALVGRRFPDYYLSRTATPETPFNRARQALYGPELLEQAARSPFDAPTRALLESVADQDLLNRMLYVDTKSWLPDDLLVKADKMTMAASVELRVPLLDHRVLEFAASLRTRHKAFGWSMKRILKRALGPTIPAEILRRKKAGFPVPYDRWMRHELRDYIHDSLFAADSFASRYLRTAEVRRLLEDQRRGAGTSKEVFSLLVLELWYQRFLMPPTGVDRQGCPPPSPSSLDCNGRAGASA